MIQRVSLSLGCSEAVQQSSTNLQGGHPEIGVNPREFNIKLFLHGDKIFYNSPKADSPEPDLWLRVFDTLCSVPFRQTAYRAIGTKLAFSKASSAGELQNAISSNPFNFRLIVVRRDNPLSGLVSLRRAQISHAWHKLSDKRSDIIDNFVGDRSWQEFTKNPTRTKIQLKEIEIVNYIWHWSKINSTLQSMASIIPSMTIQYERDIMNGDLLGGEAVI